MNLIFGAGGHGKVVYSIFFSLGKKNVLFCDDSGITKCLDIEVVKSKEIDYSKIKNAVIAIGDNRVRKKIANQYHLNFINVFDPSSIISKINVFFGKGVVVMPGSIINLNVKVGDHVIINSGSIIEHDSVIGDYVHISPGTILCGGVEVGEGTHVGAGVKIIPNIKIGKWSIIGAGAVITKDVPDFSLVVGIPGRIIKQIQNG